VSLFKEKKNILTTLLSNIISSSFLACFEQLKKLWKCHLKLYKTFLKRKTNRSTSKDLKVQNANCSYVPTHMPMTPFTSKRHNLLIISLIWNIFVALDALGEGLQNIFELQRQHNNVQRL
jgi:hypothetical protein